MTALLFDKILSPSNYVQGWRQFLGGLSFYGLGLYIVYWYTFTGYVLLFWWPNMNLFILLRCIVNIVN